MIKIFFLFFFLFCSFIAVDIKSGLEDEDIFSCLLSSDRINADYKDLIIKSKFKKLSAFYQIGDYYFYKISFMEPHFNQDGFYFSYKHDCDAVELLSGSPDKFNGMNIDVRNNFSSKKDLVDFFKSYSFITKDWYSYLVFLSIDNVDKEVNTDIHSIFDFYLGWSCNLSEKSCYVPVLVDRDLYIRFFIIGSDVFYYDILIKKDVGIYFNPRKPPER